MNDLTDVERVRLKAAACRWHEMCQQAGIPADSDATALGILLKKVQAGGYLDKADETRRLANGGIRKGWRDPQDGTQQWGVYDPEGSWSDGTFRVCVHADGTYTCDCGSWTWQNRWCHHGELVLKLTAPTAADYRRALLEGLDDLDII